MRLPSRSGGRPTVESGLTLDLYRLIRQGLLVPGKYVRGSIVWTRVNTGERTASMGYEAHMGVESGQVRLRYTTTTHGGEKRDSDYSIMLVTTPQPFGGRRWWFRCALLAKWGRHLRVASRLSAGLPISARIAARSLSVPSLRSTRDGCRRIQPARWRRRGANARAPEGAPQRPHRPDHRASPWTRRQAHWRRKHRRVPHRRRRGALRDRSADRPHRAQRRRVAGAGR